MFQRMRGGGKCQSGMWV